MWMIFRLYFGFYLILDELVQMLFIKHFINPFYHVIWLVSLIHEIMRNLCRK